ncbi:hypothetical protein LOAG_13174 [Loa loa]|uniref:Uncharacterized protein n=1 Tax=Loa loa TaxID=7209 RepID=A0A1S0TJZ8_LOALO|nr:hypothetical protein LOAG_13174 [Loa loa]EFO15338.2 hypothetical protein LOAG_13174 [Loa loa]
MTMMNDDDDDDNDDNDDVADDDDSGERDKTAMKQILFSTNSSFYSIIGLP